MPPPTAAPTLATTSPADLALVRAIRAWGEREGANGAGNPFAFLARFSPASRERVLEIWLSIARITPERAWQTLLRDHQAAVRFDPVRVHPSWFTRILKAESPAVRALQLSDADRNRLEANADAKSDVRPLGLPPADPQVVEWAKTLWSERLVGDVVDVPNDPPVILALTQLSWRDLNRLVRVLGQAKMAFAMQGQTLTASEAAAAPSNSSGRVRIGFFRRMIGPRDPRLVPLAQRDFADVVGQQPRQLAAVGLMTLARLLKGCDPHRVRWAIQHIPYPIAKRLGTLGHIDPGSHPELPLRAIRAWEAWIMEAAWARLLSEGRFGTGRLRNQA